MTAILYEKKIPPPQKKRLLYASFDDRFLENNMDLISSELKLFTAVCTRSFDPPYIISYYMKGSRLLVQTVTLKYC